MPHHGRSVTAPAAPPARSCKLCHLCLIVLIYLWLELSLFDVDGDQASQLQHAVQGQDGDGNFDGTTHIVAKVKVKLTRPHGAFHAFAGGMFHAHYPSPIFAGVQAADC